MNEDFDFVKLGGLIPAVVQDADGGEVLMVGFMNREALQRTVAEGYVTFYSRTRNKLWTKGETSGNRLRISGQLIDTMTGNHIWADRYDGALEDVFDLQDSITSSVAAVITPKVVQAEIARAQAKPTNSLSAYDLYLRALALAFEDKPDSYNQALTLLYPSSMSPGIPC